MGFSEHQASPLLQLVPVRAAVPPPFLSFGFLFIYFFQFLFILVFLLCFLESFYHPMRLHRIFRILLCVWGHLLVFSRCSSNCATCKCILDVLVRRGEVHVFHFCYLASLPHCWNPRKFALGYCYLKTHNLRLILHLCFHHHLCLSVLSNMMAT